MKPLLDAIKESDFLTVKKHISSDPELLIQEDEQGATLLSYAMRQRADMNILELLVEFGSDIYDIDNEGVSVLEYAITYGYIDMVKLLLQKGVSINKTARKSGFTPLMAAVSYNHSELVKIFLTQNPDLNAQDSSGFTALDFARRMHRKKILVLLEEHIKNHKEAL